MGEVRKTEFFTVENFKTLNGEGYRQNDVRTYAMPPLANTPYNDILIHLSLPPAGGRGGTAIRTNQGVFSGVQYSETMDYAAKLILHFPKASEIKTPKGLVQIDRKKLPGLYPSWMITRYGRANLSQSMTLQHETPLYLDKKTKDFLYFFDEAFLDELDPALLTDGVDNMVFRVYQNAERRRFLALRARDFNDFETIGNSNAKDNPVAQAWSRIQANYERLTLDSRDLEQVIVIECRRDHTSELDRERVGAHLFNSSLQMTYGMAARHNNTYYWMDENGDINTKVSGHVTRGHASSPLGLLRGEGIARTGKSTIVIPYTEEDWDKLGKIKARLDEVQNALWSLISGCEADRDSKIDHGLNHSLEALSSPKLLGIENNHSPKKDES